MVDFLIKTSVFGFNEIVQSIQMTLSSTLGLAFGIHINIELDGKVSIKISNQDSINQQGITNDWFTTFFLKMIILKWNRQLFCNLNLRWTFPKRSVSVLDPNWGIVQYFSILTMVRMVPWQSLTLVM